MPLTRSSLNLLLVLVSLTLGLLLGEAATRLIRPASDIFPANPEVDPVLGHRLRPYESGHDAKGFRNKRAEGYFPVVCIGDSEIYGTGVPRRDAIPQQLSRLIKRPVYNMALGGYGPVQYYQLWLESRPMQPQTTIIAVYLGNDLLDAYYLASRQAHWQWLLAETGDERQLSAIPPCGLPYQSDFQEDIFHDPNIITIKLKERGGPVWQLHSFLRLHSALYALSYEGLVKPIIQRLVERPQLLRQPGAFYSPMVKTIFTPGINLMALDPKDQRVRTGLLITKKILELLVGQAKSPDELILTFIPTKENVYYDFLKGKMVTLPGTFECSVHYERQIARWLSGVITSSGGRVVDLLTPLAQAAAAGGALYHDSTDAHPNAAGNWVIAETLARALPREASRFRGRPGPDISP